MPYGDPALITRGYASCPDCFARLVGYADVTLHPTIKVGKSGRLASSLTPSDELYCSRACGYRIHVTKLREQVRGGN